MQLNADFEFLQVYPEIVTLSNDEFLIFDNRHLPLPAQDITFLHYHNCCELGVVIKGNGLFTIENKVYSVGVDDIIFIPNNVKHYSKSLDADNKSRCRFIYFDAQRLLEEIGLADDKIQPILARLSSVQPIISERNGQYDALKRFTDEVFNNTNRDYKLCGVYFYEYLLKLNSVAVSQENIVHDGQMEEILRYMTLHFSEDITVSKLAKLCFLSKSQLNRRFSAAYGISPIAWLNRFRLYSAKELLKNTDYSIPEICEKSGFKNTSDLYRHFKAKFSISPTQYRANK